MSKPSELYPFYFFLINISPETLQPPDVTWALGPWAWYIAFILDFLFTIILKSPCDPLLSSHCLSLVTSSLLLCSLAWVKHILLLLHEKGYVESRFLRTWLSPNVFIFFWYLFNNHFVVQNSRLDWLPQNYQNTIWLFYSDLFCCSENQLHMITNHWSLVFFFP